ncbi:fimbria/pilus outer membrane usher protein [Dyella sp. 20L07]|uniref:fimbria/pilus outer membrane usher protein n=1 Tax=Dyella sp. 20L07 TaxID=3384240 RepID=UPI003D27B108
MRIRTCDARAQRRGITRPLVLCAGIAAALASWHPAMAAAAAANSPADASAAVDASFDRSLLSGAGSNTTDLSRFERGNPVLPGTYNVDIYMNQAWVARRDVRFAAATPQASATPCLDAKMIDQLGLHLANKAEVQTQLADPSACIELGSLIPGATMGFEMGTLRLDITVPQAYMGQHARGYVSPEYWDAGVPAGLLNYNFNSYHSTNNGQGMTTSYLGLNAGVNIGLWHLRQDSTVTWQSATAAMPARSHWQNIRSYVQRDLPSLRAQLVVGDSYTDGQVFDSFGIRGVQLSTDDRMLPDSLRGYAPVVRGVAETNALVTIRQNGVQIYQTTVAPGAFAINDLFPTGYGGNLDVIVTEADGRTRTFSVPYASVAQLLRPGTMRFSIAAGQLRDTGLEHKPNVVQATVQYGLSNLLTGYAGIVGSEGYGALLVGSAINTRYGAVALDVTESHTNIPGQGSQSGQSYRVSYSKILPETDTSLTVAAYRYSTGGYLSLSDAALARDYARRGLDAFTYIPPLSQTIDGVPVTSLLSPQQLAALSGTAFSNSTLNSTSLQRQRNRFDLTLSQRLGQSGGTFYVNASANDYWNRSGTDTQFQLGYNNSFHHVTYGVTATRTRDVFGRYANEYFLNLSLPLGDSSHAPTLMFNMNHDEASGTQEQAMVNGTAGSDNQFNYGAMASHSTSQGDAGSVNVGYRSPYALVNASYGEGRGYSQVSLGVSGAIVAHPGGVTFGQPMGDTVGIIYVPGAAGARVAAAAGARIDGAGYALIPYLSPYVLNNIQIDPKGLPLDVQLDATSAQVAPRAGAVVMLKFKTQNGRAVILRGTMENGEPLPFGAEVVDEKGQSLGIVGQAGSALVHGVAASGELTARWQDDNGNDQSCSFSYQLPAPVKGASAKVYQEIKVTCARPAGLAQVTRSGS